MPYKISPEEFTPEAQPSVGGMVQAPGTTKFSPEQQARYDQVLKQLSPDEPLPDFLPRDRRFFGGRVGLPSTPLNADGTVDVAQKEREKQGGIDAATGILTSMIPVSRPVAAAGKALKALPLIGKIPGMSSVVPEVAANIVTGTTTSAGLEAARAAADGRDVGEAVANAASFPAEVLSSPMDNKLAFMSLFGAPVVAEAGRGALSSIRNLRERYRQPGTNSGDIIRAVEEGANLPATQKALRELPPGPNRVTQATQDQIESVYNQSQNVDQLASDMYGEGMSTLEGNPAATTQVPYATGHNILDSKIQRTPLGSPTDADLNDLMSTLKREYMSKDPRKLPPRLEPVRGTLDVSMPNDETPGNPMTYDRSQRMMGRGYMSDLGIVPEAAPPIVESQMMSRIQREIPKDPREMAIPANESHVPPEAPMTPGTIPVEMSTAQMPPETNISAGMPPGESIGAHGNEVWSKGYVAQPGDMTSTEPLSLPPVASIRGGGWRPTNVESGVGPLAVRKKAGPVSKFPDVGTPEQVSGNLEPITSLVDLQNMKKAANEATYRDPSTAQKVAHPGRKVASGGAIEARDAFWKSVPEQDQAEVLALTKRLQTIDQAYGRAKDSGKDVLDLLFNKDPKKYLDPDTGKFNMVKFREDVSQAAKQLGRDNEPGAVRRARAELGSKTPDKLEPIQVPTDVDPLSTTVAPSEFGRERYLGTPDQAAPLNLKLRDLNDAENTLRSGTSDAFKTIMALNGLEASSWGGLGKSQVRASLSQAVAKPIMYVNPFEQSRLNLFKRKFAGAEMSIPGENTTGGWADRLLEAGGKMENAVPLANGIGGVMFQQLADMANQAGRQQSYQQRDNRAESLIQGKKGR